MDCSICDDKGFVPYGISVAPCRCKGGSPETQRLLREIGSLSDQISKQNTEQSKRVLRNETQQPQFREPRCPECGGKGFSSLHIWTDLDITKCRKCNGTGTLGMALPVIERLWYEIKRLYEYINKREREWAQKFQVEMRSPHAAPPVEPRIRETDVWRFILGLKDGEDVDKAFKRRAMDTHPDRGGSDLAFRIVRLAHEKLKEESA